MGFFDSIGDGFKSIGKTIAKTGKGVLSKIPIVNKIPGLSGGGGGGDDDTTGDGTTNFDITSIWTDMDPKTQGLIMEGGLALLAFIIVIKLIEKL